MTHTWPGQHGKADAAGMWMFTYRYLVRGGKHRTNTVPLCTLRAPGAFTYLLVRLQERWGWDGAGRSYVRDYTAVILVFGAGSKHPGAGSLT